MAVHEDITVSDDAWHLLDYICLQLLVFEKLGHYLIKKVINPEVFNKLQLNSKVTFYLKK